MEMKEILKTIMAVNEEGKSDTAVSFGVYDVAGEEAVEKSFDSILGPKIKIHGMFDKIMVDLIFANDRDVDLYKVWNILNKYQKEMHESTLDETKVVPYLNIVMLPMSHEGHVYADANTPMLWTLTSLGVGKPIDTIRLVFSADKINFYTSDDIDISDVKAEIIMDINKRENLNQMDEKRRQYRYQRMKEIEENRRKNM